MLILKMWPCGHEPSNADSHQKLEEAKDRLSPSHLTHTLHSTRIWTPAKACCCLLDDVSNYRVFPFHLISRRNHFWFNFCHLLHESTCGSREVVKHWANMTSYYSLITFGFILCSLPPKDSKRVCQFRWMVMARWKHLRIEKRKQEREYRWTLRR